MQPNHDSVVGYFKNLTKLHQCVVFGFLSKMVSVLGNVSNQKPISMQSLSVSGFLTCSTASAMEDDHAKFYDVRVNPSKLKTAEMKCLSSKDPSRILLNKVADVVFSQKEYFQSKGVTGLDKHKEEALKEYLHSKGASMAIDPVTPKVYTTALQNKNGNTRHTQKPKLSKV